ncbi:MAG: NAD(P)H-hydrate dehydratase [Myxococcota bacterium]|jgi:NAD(P)H-hydrate epimerase|nr:NAD(P)H-hydrate dehydratase [Myxococcota bacterium]
MWDKNLFMTRDQIRAYDKIATEEFGIASLLLMENAGLGAAAYCQELLRGHGRVGVLAGGGNNGGDGFVLARHLINQGVSVATYLTTSPPELKGDALLNYKTLKAMDAAVFDVSTPASSGMLEQRLRADGFVVDALLGTGVSRELEGHIAYIIELVNSLNLPVLSLDLPSGVDANTGRPWGRAIRATATATFGHLKRGLLLHPGAELSGRIRVIPLGAPCQTSIRSGFDGRLLDDAFLRGKLKRRPPDSHKGTYGHLLVVAGTSGKTGAASMVGQAAMRCGAGLVTLATTEKAQPVLEAKCQEAMVESLMERADSPLNDKTLKQISAVLDGKAAVALGPGLGTAPGISAMAVKLLQMCTVPAVVDADGINILAKDPSGAGRINAPMVLTPHPGEMARLLNISIPHVQADRIGTARDAARRQGMVIVLKGANTVIADPDGRAFVNPTGNPGMSTGGMGDVLTGMIGAFLAQGIAPLDAALLGAYLHGKSGDLARDSEGEIALIAADVIAQLPRVLRAYETA